jgi:hypothetical protein
MALNNGVEQVSAINKTSLNNFTKPTPPPTPPKNKTKKERKRKEKIGLAIISYLLENNVLFQKTTMMLHMRNLRII